MKYLVVIEPTSTGFSAYSPDLPGCVSTGASREECERNMHEAIAFHLDGLRQEGESIPPPTTSAAFVESLLTRQRRSCNQNASAERTGVAAFLDSKLAGDHPDRRALCVSRTPNVPEILVYDASARRWFPWRQLSLVAAVSGLVYWRFADWYAYVGSGPTATPKFEMPLWWQVVESSTVGLAAAAFAWLLWFAVRRNTGR